ncbi:hypothetical protein ABIB57_004304 [Devosia sp. UYZn731]|uniref:hypothetical protein n=1 Tax=Devosia sp. UYZn731 TaxID=3156345 RepID=UPI0033917BE7
MSNTFAGLVGFVVVLAACPTLAQDIVMVDLGYDVTLTVEQNTEIRGVRVAVSQLENEWQSVGIGNAGFTPEDVQMVKLCSDCAQVYFVPIWDIPRNYGTATGVILYERGAGGWSLAILPLDRPTIEDEDGKGVFALFDNPPNAEPIEYVFRDGLVAVAS